MRLKAHTVHTVVDVAVNNDYALTEYVKVRRL